VTAERFEIVEPNAAAMIESMRAVGYTLQAALADLIDNSLSAAARNIWLTFFWSGATSFISVRDDGVGMSEDELTEAMRLGTRSPLDERDPHDLGRFGLGLKTASFSQCRRLTVRSRFAGKNVSTRRWDLDYVTKTREWRLLMDADPGSEERLVLPNGEGGGTVVLWEHIDRVVEGASLDDDRAHRRFLDLAETVEDHAAMIFHRFLEPPADVTIWINDQRVEPWDPFLKTEQATQRLGEEPLTLDGSQIMVRPYVLPHHSKLEPRVHKRAAGPAGWNAQQGFYVYRNRRLLVAGDWLRLGFQKEEHAKLARIQVDLPNTVDSAWHIDVKKSFAQPPGPLRDDFRRLAKLTRERATEIYRHRGKVIARTTVQEDSFVWHKMLKRGKIFYRINRSHPLVRRTLQDLNGQSADLEALLRMVEETIPTPLIALDASEKPDEHARPFEDAPLADVKDVLARVYRALRASGIPDAEARVCLLAIEPFNHYPELVTSLEEDFA
jgi:hypothetical protein